MKHAAALLALAAASVLGVAACGGGGGAPATPAASPTTSASPALSPIPQPGTHTAQSAEPALIAVPGYDYADFPGAAPSAKAIVSTAPQVYKSGSMHLVLHGGKKFAVITLLQVKPAIANLPGTQLSMVSELATEMAGSGAKVTQKTIRTEKVVIARTGSIVDYAWYHGGAVTIVTDGTGPDLRNFVEAYLKRAHA